MDRRELPVVVIGAGPVGLAAAAQLLVANETPIVLEAGDTVAASVRAWGHVRLFSPWKYNVDRSAAALLEPSGWIAPDGDSFPTGDELIDRYLAPLAALPQMRSRIRLGTRVVSVTRAGFDKMKTAGREQAPFVVLAESADGETEILAKAVIDASGTYRTPNPLGASGVAAPGERSLSHRMFYGIPDVLHRYRDRYAGRSVLVVGSGHSAFNALLDLAQLADQQPDTTITWAVRRADMRSAYGGGANDALAARGELGSKIRALVEVGRVRLVSGFRIRQLRPENDGVLVVGEDSAIGPFDEIIATTGFRPDLGFLRELRLDLDSAVESPTALAPLIDPNLHSCGTVRPHGAEELKHPDADFYIVGMKSYGRAPTFLMMTGYEQVRSVVAAIRGDWDAARRVELELPETGVCFTDFNAAAGACCGSAGGAIGASDCGPAASCAIELSDCAPVAIGGRSGCCG